VRTRFTLYAAIALIAAGLLAYSTSFTGQFVLDDHIFIKNLQAGPLHEFLFAPENRPRPVVALSLALNYVLGGLAPWGYHLFNLAIHILAALALFGIIRRTLRLESLRARFGAAADWLALAVALLWLAHPLQTESVTYIIQRAESLAGLFYLLTLYCVIRATEKTLMIDDLRPGSQSAIRNPRSAIFFILAVLACALGMACKPTVATAPLVVFAYDRIFLAGSTAQALRRRWGLYAALASTWLLLAALIKISPPPSGAGFGLPLTPLAYAATQCGVILHYLRLSLWPVGLCFDYQWPVADNWSAVLPGALVLGALGLATLWAWFKMPAWSFFGIWFFVILAPTSSFMPIADVAVEHRMYLPLAAVQAFVLVSFYLLGTQASPRLSLPKSCLQMAGGTPAIPRIFGFTAINALIAAAILLGFLTWQRNQLYQAPLSLWQDVLDRERKSWRAFNGMGIALSLDGKYEKAFACFDAALKINPQAIEVLNNRGATHEKQGDLASALSDYTEALETNPKQAEAYFNRANARQRTCDYVGALTDYGQALFLRPRDAKIFNNRGNARMEHGDLDGAISDYTEALDLNPRYGHAYCSRGAARGQKGACAEALADFDKALDLDRSNWQAWLGKGLVLVKMGQTEQAKPCFDKSLEINPNLKNALPDMIANAQAEKNKKAVP
jgi:tetratricopeptide (TPR) repeat protein